MQLCCKILKFAVLLMLKINYDRLGIVASIVCAIHCTLLPLVISTLPILGLNLINNLFFEVSMILISLLIGIYSLRHGFTKHHHKLRPILLFTLGMFFLVLKQVFHPHQIWFLAPAVLLIISAHYINLRLCRKAAHEHGEHCSH